MAGHAKSTKLSVAAGGRTNQRTRKRSANNRRAFGELMLIASEQGVTRKPGQSSAEVLQEVLDRAVGGMRYAASEVDKLDPEEFWVHKYDAQLNKLVEPNKWYQLELACRAEVERIAGLMSQLGIAERQVQVEEARAVLIIGAIRDAAREAGIEPHKIKVMGQRLRDKLSPEEQAA